MKLSNALSWTNFICFYFTMAKSVTLVLKDWFYVEAASVMQGRKGVCRQESQSILRRPKGHFVSWRTWQKVMFWVFSFPALSPGEPKISQKVLEWTSLYLRIILFDFFSQGKLKARFSSITMFISSPFLGTFLKN